jgi:hypothetical protein
VSEFLITIDYKKFEFLTIFRCTVGLSDVAIAVINNLRIGYYPNSYAFRHLHECWLAGERHPFELPEGALRPRWKPNGMNIYGCGLVLDPNDKLAIFFTLNGILMGELVLVLEVLRLMA